MLWFFKNFFITFEAFEENSRNVLWSRKYSIICVKNFWTKKFGGKCIFFSYFNSRISFIYLFIYLFIYFLFIYSFIHSFIYLFTYLSFHLLIYWFQIEYAIKLFLKKTIGRIKNTNDIDENHSSRLQRKILSNNDTKKKLNEIYEKHISNLNIKLIKYFGESKRVPDSWNN